MPERISVFGYVYVLVDNGYRLEGKDMGEYKVDLKLDLPILTSEPPAQSVVSEELLNHLIEESVFQCDKTVLEKFYECISGYPGRVQSILLEAVAPIFLEGLFGKKGGTHRRTGDHSRMKAKGRMKDKKNKRGRGAHKQAAARRHRRNYQDVYDDKWLFTMNENGDWDIMKGRDFKNRFGKDSEVMWDFANERDFTYVFTKTNDRGFHLMPSNDLLDEIRRQEENFRSKRRSRFEGYELEGKLSEWDHAVADATLFDSDCHFAIMFSIQLDHIVDLLLSLGALKADDPNYAVEKKKVDDHFYSLFKNVQSYVETRRVAYLEGKSSVPTPPVGILDSIYEEFCVKDDAWARYIVLARGYDFINGRKKVGKFFVSNFHTFAFLNGITDDTPMVVENREGEKITFPKYPDCWGPAKEIADTVYIESNLPKEKKGLKVAKEPPSVGDLVWVATTDENHEIHLVHTFITAVFDGGLEHDVTTKPGDCGLPVVSETGKLLGIHMGANQSACCNRAAGCWRIEGHALVADGPHELYRNAGHLVRNNGSGETAAFLQNVLESVCLGQGNGSPQARVLQEEDPSYSPLTFGRGAVRDGQ
jgi:hypothetical protein